MLARINKRYVPTYWDDFFNDNFFNNFQVGTWNNSVPAVNVEENENAYTIEVAVPGLSKNDFRIDLEDHVLTVSSEQKDEKKEEKRNYMRREFSYNSFKRSFQLPESVDMDKIKASHEAGVLIIHLPKREEVLQKAPKQIEIN